MNFCQIFKIFFDFLFGFRFGESGIYIGFASYFKILDKAYKLNELGHCEQAKKILSVKVSEVVAGNVSEKWFLDVQQVAEALIAVGGIEALHNACDIQSVKGDSSTSVCPIAQEQKQPQATCGGATNTSEDTKRICPDVPSEYNPIVQPGCEVGNDSELEWECNYSKGQFADFGDEHIGITILDESYGAGIEQGAPDSPIDHRGVEEAIKENEITVPAQEVLRESGLGEEVQRDFTTTMGGDLHDEIDSVDSEIVDVACASDNSQNAVNAWQKSFVKVESNDIFKKNDLIQNVGITQDDIKYFEAAVQKIRDRIKEIQQDFPDVLVENHGRASKLRVVQNHDDLLLKETHTVIIDELETIARLGNGWQDFVRALINKKEFKFVEDFNLDHILAPEIVCRKGKWKCVGFHHDYLGRLKASKLLEYEQHKNLENGFYEVRWRYGDTDFKFSTFFPDDWTPAQVLNVIGEALHRPDIAKTLQSGKLVLKAPYSPNINIIVVLEANSIGKPTGRIISMYPSRVMKG